MADKKEEELKSLPLPTEDDWSEVEYINSYAMTMAYLAMGVRGLAYLVITWTTVVLLGGFVGVLSKKDFWGLTLIIFAQTAGVFDVFLREKLSKIGYVYVHLVNRCVLSITSVDDEDDYCPVFLCMLCMVGKIFVKLIVQALALSIVLCPLAAVYVFGLVISTGISLWRLIQQDYGGAGGSANLKPALQVLYSLALVQGVLFCCRFLFARTEKKIIKEVCDDYKFLGAEAEVIISDYLHETRIGCEKDPTFAQGRNLITYAVDLIKSEAPGKVISGVRILERLVSIQYYVFSTKQFKLDRVGQHMLIKVLVGSASSSRILLHKLVQMLDPRCPYSMETRRCAATIVVHLAGDIHLEQFPRGLHCITSLLNEEYSVMDPYQRDWLLEKFVNERSPDEMLANYRQAYRDIGEEEEPEPCRLSLSNYIALAAQGLRILCKLARDEGNCRVMCNDQGLVSKIIAVSSSPSSDKFHQDNHPEWYRMAIVTAQLLILLARAPGESGQQLQRQISTNTQAISALLESIFRCKVCSGSLLQRQAIVMLSDLCFHKSASSIASERSRRQSFVQMLIDIFADDNQATDTRKEAGVQLAKLSSASNYSKATVTLILEARGAINNLTGVILDTKHSNRTSLRTIAEEILKNTFRHCNNDDECRFLIKDDECLAKLKTYITDDVLPKVLREIVRLVHWTDIKEFPPPDADIEKGLVLEDIAQNTASSPQQNAEQPEDWKLQEALLSLCAMVQNKFTSEDPDLAHQFDEIAADICLEEQVKPVRTFTSILEEARQQLVDAKAQGSTRIGNCTSCSRKLFKGNLIQLHHTPAN